MLLREFQADLTRFGADVDGRATLVFRDACATTAEAIVIGNQYGPGAPLDTGFLRASFQIGRNTPVDGPSTRPSMKGRTKTARLFEDALDLGEIASFTLDDVCFVTTSAEYAEYLEFNGLTRRNGAHVGQDTAFVAPVADRFAQIVDDAAARVGFDAP